MKPFLTFLLYISLTCSAFSQEEQNFTDEINRDELGNVADEFQEKFFSAIAQRAILNHEKANELLNELVQISPQEGVLYLEKAKNHFALEQYDAAENNYLKALKTLPDKALVEAKINLLNVYQATQNYSKGLATANELAVENVNFLEVSATILMTMKQPKEALKALDELEIAIGVSESSESLREVIYMEYQLYKEAIKYYKNKTQSEPKNVLWYAKLMHFYNENTQLDKLIKTGEEALTINPYQPDVLTMLCLAYLKGNEIEKAIPYLESSLSHNEVSEQNKVLIIQSLKHFVAKNPAYQSEFIRILDLAIATGESNASNEEKGKYLRSKDKEKALKSFKLALQDYPGKLSVIQEIIKLHLDLKQYIEAIEVSIEALEIYPTLSELFLLKSKAEIGLERYKNAINSLQEGLDYLVDFPELERQIYLQLSIAYQGLQMDDKADEFREKAEKE